MEKNNTYKLSEIPAPNYDAWEFRTRISAQSKDLLETLLDNNPELTTSQNSKIWKPWKSRKDAATELLVNTLEDDHLIHIRGLETEPAKMWERLKTVHKKTGVAGSATDLWTLFHTCYIHQFIYSTSKSHFYNLVLCRGSRTTSFRQDV
jgi:hypothetical protein